MACYFKVSSVWSTRRLWLLINIHDLYYDTPIYHVTHCPLSFWRKALRILLSSLNFHCLTPPPPPNTNSTFNLYRTAIMALIFIIIIICVQICNCVFMYYSVEPKSVAVVVEMTVMMTVDVVVKILSAKGKMVMMGWQPNSAARSYQRPSSHLVTQTLMQEPNSRLMIMRK